MNKARSTSSLLGTAARGSILSFSGTLAGKVLFFLTRVIITRMFGEQYFGFLMIGLLVSELSRIVASIGLPKGGMRFLSVAVGRSESEQFPFIFGTAILIPFFLSIAISALLFSLAGFISVAWFDNPKLTLYLRLFAIGIPFATIMRVGLDLSRGFNTTKYAVLVENLFVPALIIALFLLFCSFRLAFPSIIYAIILANISGAGLILFFLSKQLKAFNGPSWDDARFLKGFSISRKSIEIVSYSVPLFLTGCTGILINSTDIFMLGHFVHAGSVGIYAAAATFATFFSSLLIMSVNSIFAPLIATHYGRNDPDKIRHLYIATTRWIFYVSLPIVAFVMIARNHIMLIFGKGFETHGAAVLLVLSLGHMVNCLTGGVGYMLSMTSHQKKELAINAVAVAQNIILNIILIQRYGIIGAAIATASTLTTVNVLRLLVVYRIFRVQPFTMKLFKFFAGSAAIVLAALVLQAHIPGQRIDMLFACLGSAMIVCCIFLCKLESEDKELIKTLIVKRPWK